MLILYCWLDRLVAGPRWRWGLAGVCLLAAVLGQLPKYPHAYAQLITHTEPLDEKLARQLAQAAHPFTPFADDSRTHLAKMTFRLAVPLLLRYTHLPLVTLLGLQALLGYWMYYFAAGWLAAHLRDRLAAALLTLGLSQTYFGFTFTYDLSGYFDGLGYAVLLGLLGMRRWGAAFGLLLAGAWVDERVLAAAPLLVAWYGLRQYPEAWPGWRRWLGTHPATALYAAGAAYALLRLALTARYHLAAPGGLVGASALAHNAWHELLALGVVTGLKSYWLPIILAGLLLWRQRRYAPLLGLAVCAAPSVAGAVLVTDITRSLAYATPLALMALALLARRTTLAERRRLAAVVLAGAVLIPSYFTTGWLQYAAPAWTAALREWARYYYAHPS